MGGQRRLGPQLSPPRDQQRALEEHWRMDSVRKVIGRLRPRKKTSEDGRDQWPSRTAFILAAAGGAIGQGNIIRFPSQVFNNIGLQWFIPYLLAIFLLAIPGLILEVSIGQTYRGGPVVSFNSVHYRMRGVGLASVLISAVVVVYFAIILVWIAIYFRHSFSSPLPWVGRTTEFYNDQVLRQVDPIPGEFAPDGSVISYVSYPGIKLIGETVGWSAFIWFCVLCCMFGGVSVTGRAVYFTMAIPIVTTFIILIRAVTLDNAARGVKLYFATWNGSQLAQGQIWQTAVGQVFFSTGVAFGYYISYASYNAKYANAVQDAVIIVCSNCAFEIIAAFGVFAIVGFLGIEPSNTPRLGAFEIGFLTFPAALATMPGAQFWSVLFFLTLLLLGISSTYPMLDVICTFIMDRWGHRVNRPTVAITLTLVAFLISLMYCTQFGYYLLDGIDRWINNMTLVFAAWAEFSFSTSIYRYHDLFQEVGKPSYFIFNAGYFGGQVLGVAIGHAVSPAAGAGVGFGLFIGGAVLSLALARTPREPTPKPFATNAWLKKVYYLAFYSGNQLRRDLNVVVAQGKNWNIPSFWAILLRYISAPTLAIVFSFGYPEFYTLRNDPVYIVGFIIAHIVIAGVVVALLVPRWAAVIVPYENRHDGRKPVAPGVILTPGNDIEDAREVRTVAGEDGPASGSPLPIAEKEKQKPIP